MAAFSRSGAHAGECGQALEWYQQHSFTVREVNISTPLQLFPSVRQRAQELRDVIPLKAGQPFDPALMNAGLVPFRDALSALLVNPYARVAVRIIPPPGIRNCDDQARLLEVDYIAYTVNPGSVFTNLFETQNDAAGRAVPSASASRFFRDVRPGPYIGYDPARHLFGGTRLDLRSHVALFSRTRLNIAGSGTSLLVDAALSGSKDLPQGFVRGIEWSLAYRYEKLPAAEAVVRNARLAAQFSAVSAPFGSSGSVFRFGGSLEGGHSQSAFDPAFVRPGDLLTASTGSVKLFTGWSGLLAGNPAKASYGLQLGKAGPGVQLDYAKHIVNAEYAARFLPVWHRAITLDAAFAAGRIQDTHRVPVGERFFGGNQPVEFIAGSSWSIQSSPIVRSLPINRLTRFSGTGLIGSDSFAGLSTTTGFNVWGRPLVPDTVLQAPKFEQAVQLALATAGTTLYDSYLGEKKAFLPLRKATVKAIGQLRTVRDALVRIGAPENIPSLSDDLKDALTICAKKTAKALDPLADKQDNELVPTDAMGLFQDLPPEDEDDFAVPSKLGDLAESLKNLDGLLTDPRLAAPRAALASVITDWSTDLPAAAAALKSLEETPDAATAHAQAHNEMRFPERTLHRLLYDLNLIGLSPVAIFDAAHITQSFRRSTSETRYALGGGLKLSFVSLDFTVGYAANPFRQFGEPAGAFVFTLALADIFR